MKLSEVMASGTNWAGSLEALTTVDVSAQVEWLKNDFFDEWPSLPKIRNCLERHNMPNQTECGFREALEPIVNQIMEQFPGCSTRQWMLSVVMPGQHVARHMDHQPVDWIVRIHVPLTTNDKAIFFSGDVPHNLKVGTAYLINTKVEHEIMNDGDVPRIHFMFDIVGPHGYGTV